VFEGLGPCRNDSAIIQPSAGGIGPRLQNLDGCYQGVRCCTIRMAFWANIAHLCQSTLLRQGQLRALLSHCDDVAI